MTATSNDRAVLLLRMLAEATRTDLLNVETITNALHNELSTEDLIYAIVASDLIAACYKKLLSEMRYNELHGEPLQEYYHR